MANKIRELITERLRGLKDSGLGDRDEMLTSQRPAILAGEPAVIGPP